MDADLKGTKNKFPPDAAKKNDWRGTKNNFPPDETTINADLKGTKKKHPARCRKKQLTEEEPKTTSRQMRPQKLLT